MNNNKRYLVTVGLCLTLLLTGCGTADLKSYSQLGHNASVDQDELKISNAALEQREEFRRLGLLLPDKPLVDYLDGLVSQLVLPELREGMDYNFFILRDATVNAFAMPNGDIYVTVGLIHQLEDPLQLMQILAHEAAHVQHRHGYERLLNRKSKSFSFNLLNSVLLGSGLAYAPYASRSMAGHSRENEKEADLYGLDYMANSGFSIEGSGDLFEVMNEIDNAETVESSPYRSHPDNDERKSYINAHVNENFFNHSPTKQLSLPKFRAFQSAIAFENIKLKLRGKYYFLSLRTIDKVENRFGYEPELDFYRAEAYRKILEDPFYSAKEYAWINGKEYSEEVKSEIIGRSEEFRTQSEKYYLSLLVSEQWNTFANRGVGLLYEEVGNTDLAIKYLKAYLDGEQPKKDKRFILRKIEKLELKNAKQ